MKDVTIPNALAVRSRRAASLAALALAAVPILPAAFSAAAQQPAAQPAAPQAAPKHVEVATIAPRPEDVATMDGIIKAFYDVISGPAGHPREWARDRTLYMPGIRFVAMSVKDGKITKEISDHQEFVDRSDAALVKEGFYETEIHRVTKRFGNIAHVFSTYEMRHTPGGPLIGRGVNSLQLFWDGTRWWIASDVWDDERKDNPLPKDLLPAR